MKNARICHFFGLTQFGLLLLTSLLCCNKCTASQGKRHFFPKHFFVVFKSYMKANNEENVYEIKFIDWLKA